MGELFGVCGLIQGAVLVAGICAPQTSERAREVL